MNLVHRSLKRVRAVGIAELGLHRGFGEVHADRGAVDDIQHVLSVVARRRNNVVVSTRRVDRRRERSCLRAIVEVACCGDAAVFALGTAPITLGMRAGIVDVAVVAVAVAGAVEHVDGDLRGRTGLIGAQGHASDGCVVGIAMIGHRGVDVVHPTPTAVVQRKARANGRRSHRFGVQAVRDGSVLRFVRTHVGIGSKASRGRAEPHGLPAVLCVGGAWHAAR